MTLLARLRRLEALPAAACPLHGAEPRIVVRTIMPGEPEPADDESERCPTCGEIPFTRIYVRYVDDRPPRWGDGA